MEPITDYNSILFEPKALCRSCQQWLSDLELIEKNLASLPKLYRKAFFKLIKQTGRIQLKHEVVNYLHTLKDLAKDRSHPFSINIAMVHSNLQLRLNKLLKDFTFVKRIVYDFAQNALKGDRIGFRPLAFSNDMDLTEDELERFCYSTKNKRQAIGPGYITN